MMKDMKPFESLFLDLRGQRHHVRSWGRIGARKLFMLHGWGDTSVTFQFLVDALAGDWHVLAPDWRGFGQSARGADAYWFPDYLADLDALLRHTCPREPVALVGHSMGGNIACLYAGIRPARLSHVVSLDAFGLPDRASEEAPGRYEKWLNQLAAPQAFRTYPDVDAFARRMLRDNPRLTPEKAMFLAGHMTEPDVEGGVRVAIDPAHRNVNPVLYRRSEVESCWRRVNAKVLWLGQADPAWRRGMGIADDVYRAGAACFKHFSEQSVPDAGHHLHHDQPAQVAMAIETFLNDSTYSSELQR